MIFTRPQWLPFKGHFTAITFHASFFCLAVFMTPTAKSQAGTLHVPADYKTIQEAVNNASPRDTIIVNEGSYAENIVITKPLTIISDKGPDALVVHAAAPGKPVFTISNVREGAIAGFTATGSTIAGIYLDNSSNVEVRDNKTVGNGTGIILNSSRDNTLANNLADSNTQYGIYLKSSEENILDSNSAKSNKDTGIFLSSSGRNSLTDNNISLNTWNGITLWASHNNLMKGNKAHRNMFAIVMSESNDNTLINNSTWPNIYLILPIVLIYIGIVAYLIQKNLIRYLLRE